MQARSSPHDSPKPPSRPERAIDSGAGNPHTVRLFTAQARGTVRPMPNLSRVLAALLGAALLPAAQAALTPVNASGAGNGAERCLSGIFCAGGSYGGAPSILFSYAVDRGFAFNSLQRVDDSLDRTWSVVSASAAVRSIARYAGDQGQLGVTSGAGVSMLTPVLQNSSLGVENPGLFAGSVRSGDFRQLSSAWTALPGAIGSPFAFVLQNLTSSLLLASDTALGGFSNSGYAQDWMVTWRVPGQDTYLIAWEDRRNIVNGRPNDYDYNDYVLEVRGVSPYSGGGMTGQGDPPPVPLPPALWLMLSALGIFGAAFRRRVPAPPGNP
jgi:hypothetical protein